MHLCISPSDDRAPVVTNSGSGSRRTGRDPATLVGHEAGEWMAFPAVTIPVETTVFGFLGRLTEREPQLRLAA